MMYVSLIEFTTAKHPIYATPTEGSIFGNSKKGAGKLIINPSPAIQGHAISNTTVITKPTELNSMAFIASNINSAMQNIGTINASTDDSMNMLCPM